VICRGYVELQFVRAPGLSSWAIGYFGGMRYSHVDCRLPDGTLFGARDDWQYGATGAIPPGVQRRPPDYTRWLLITRMQVRATIAQERAFYEFLFAQEGKEYDEPAIWGFAEGRDWREADSWFCSELLAAAEEIAKILPILCTPTNKVIPGTLATVNSALFGTTWQALKPTAI